VFIDANRDDVVAGGALARRDRTARLAALTDHDPT